MLSYPGYACRCCGKWTDEPFTIPKYQSAGGWWDTWGLCDECINVESDEDIKNE
jgi:hypothetical protein